jgi:tetratricopeptide (TPR) repeat protein
MSESEKSFDIESFWEYGDPAASEQRFQAALEQTEGDLRLELLTQIARTHGLRGDFKRAHSVLDQVEGELAAAGPRPAVRYLLERGRTHNSSGDPDRARALFEQAWEQARRAELEGLAVDAAHMVAITYSGSEQAIDWNRRGLEIARQSHDGKAVALIPAMLNNNAWDLHEMGRFDEALDLFREALDAWTARGKPKQIQIARWSVARCLRSQGQFHEALDLQRELEAEHEAAGTADGYVFEELGELLAALGRSDEARPYFRRAYDELSSDEWFAEHEAERLASLKARA